ncbi:MAG: peptidyl-prolyl cis-trans isomerase [Candidatus Omnitrophota bacterium]
MKTKVFFGVLLLMLTSLSLPARGEKIDRIVAIVNGDVITQDELDTFARMAMLDGEAEPPVKDPVELRRFFLERMVEDKLILQEAKRMQLKTDEEVIEGRIRDIRFRAGSEAGFQQALLSQGITLSELREKLKNQYLIFLAVQREVKRKSQVSPKEVTEFYEKNKALFLAPDTLVVDSIFIEDPQALKEAESILSRGGDFDETARLYSKRGSIGKVSRGQLKKDLEDFIFSLSPGEPSKPFGVEKGHYIFLVKEKIPASEKQLDEVKERVIAMLENEKAELILKTWLEQLKDKAYISIRQ